MTFQILIDSDDVVALSRLATCIREKGFRVREVEQMKHREDTFGSESAASIIVDVDSGWGNNVVADQPGQESGDTGTFLMTMRKDRPDEVAEFCVGGDQDTEAIEKDDLPTRIQALLYQISGGGSETPSGGGMNTIGSWHFDRIVNRLVSAEQVLSLTAQELKVLSILVDHPNQTLSQAKMAALMGRTPGQASDRRINLVVEHLQQKLELDQANPKWIVSEASKGHRLVTSTQS
ncbi:MAG: winged helix-turn-helix domain-containing protein [Ruegeria sp.]|uniref:winged helix-turn-helix domain-containing protein n=1 Tax=Ruegeria sp. TaxID=1879320 RepID=UPI00349EBEDE